MNINTQNRKITIDNFYCTTEAIFKGCKTPKRKPDYISYDSLYEGRISSRYWYGKDSFGSFVIRESNHWVKTKKIGSNNITKNCKSIGSCQWNLKTNNEIKNTSGKCYLSEFKNIK